MKESNWDFEQNQEPNSTQDWNTMHNQCEITWLSYEFA
jgi:hypothetical protein